MVENLPRQEEACRSTATDDKEIVECPTCGRDDFKNERGLKQHHARTHGERLVGGDFDGECPTCGRSDFRTGRGMRIHHAKVHGESLSIVEVNCDYCDATREISSYKLKIQQNVYCSPECQHRDKVKDRVGVECEYCGTTERVKPGRAKSYRFCSTDCKADWEQKNWTGENGPNWRGRIEKVCKTCGEAFEVRQSRERRQFCGRDCMYEWFGEWISGDNHPMWKGGYDEYYGPNWHKQRRKARERDGFECRVCGKPDEENRRQLPVHHIQPKRAFEDKNGNYDYEEGNRLENLITLCDACHPRWEGIPLRPDNA